MLNKLNKVKYTKKWIILLIYLLLINKAFALPPLPSQFYGAVIINGVEAPIGTNISAYDVDNVKCGFITTNEVGKYILSCKGDNLGTEIDEGAKPGDRITLYVNDVTANISKAAVWGSGSFNEIEISINYSTISTISYSPVDNRSYLHLFYIILILIIVFLVIIILAKRGNKT